MKIGEFLPPSETFIYRRISDPQLEHAVVTESQQNQTKYPLTKGVTLCAFDKASRCRQWIGTRFMNHTGRCWWYTQAILRQKPDVVHGHFGAAGWAALPACEKANIPLIVTLYGSDFHTVYKQSPVWKRRTDALFQKARYITAISDYMIEELRIAGCREEKLVKIRCGIDLEELRFQKKYLDRNETLRILCVARLHPVKGIEYLLPACQILKEKQKKFELRIIGDGPLREKLQQTSNELDVDECVHFLLDTPRAETVANFGWCHLLVLTSLMESQGIVLQEAQATGTPVIGTRTGAVPESLEDEKTGFLVPLRDPAAIAEAVCRFIDHPELISSMGEKGRRFVEEHFDVKNELKSLRELYRRAMEMRK